jgi:2-aminoadipate transaminase
MDWSSTFARRTALMRRSAVREILKLTAQPDMISFAGGLPAPDLFPLPEVREAVATVLATRGQQALQYGETEGVAELRDAIAQRFSRPAFRVRRDNVAIVSGGQQGLDLIGRILIDEGDTVVVENPTYLALLSAWRPLGAHFEAVGSDADGMQVEALEELLRKKPKLIYATPTFQNPQGTTLSASRRRKLAALLRHHGVGLLEDNAYGELRYSGEHLPHVFELDAAHGGQGADGALDSRVIYVGTFSKVLMPGLRVGWVIADAQVIDKLVQAKQAADLHTATLNQHLVLQLIESGLLERHMESLCAAYRTRRDLMLTAIARHFPHEARWTRPDGGMFLMVTMPPDFDAVAVLKQALVHKVAYVPGEEFFVGGAGRNTFRLNFSNARPEQIEHGIERLGCVLKDSLSSSPASA